MWRRWNHYNGNRGPSIGHPTLIETTIDDGYLETIPEVDSVKSKRSSGSTTLPELPFRAVAPMQRSQQQHREPVWSQPSPTIPDYYEPTSRGSHDDQYLDISPPSSPRKSNPDISIEDAPISPIDSESPFSTHLPVNNNVYRSRIPQRVVSNKVSKPQPDEEEKFETRWDAYSGEPTNEGFGLPSTVRPGTQLLEHQFPQLKERTKQILAGIRERETASKPVWVEQPPPVSAPDPLDHVVRKEPWRGPSGRTALVDPVQNNPMARIVPLQHPQHDIGRTQETNSKARLESPTHTLRTVTSEESLKPIAPLKITTKLRNPSPQSSEGDRSPPFFDTIQSAPPAYQHPKSLQSPFSSPGLVRSTETPITPVNARSESPPCDQAPDTPQTPTPPASYVNAGPIKIQQMPAEPDISRFSWTTYATSVTESPGTQARGFREESSPPPLPHIPQLYIKKRPVSEAYVAGLNIRKNRLISQANSVTRKPIANRPRASSGSAFSQLSLSKTLPQIPPEWEATDKIANLEAQLNALAMRKHNTNRIIRDLNENLKKNAIVYDIWKRKDISDRISNHELELQNIANEEHDIGLRLHRVQRKRDVEDNYEMPTALWIRRVTS